jgi:hypothetical protein
LNRLPEVREVVIKGCIFTVGFAQLVVECGWQLSQTEGNLSGCLERLGFIAAVEMGYVVGLQSFGKQRTFAAAFNREMPMVWRFSRYGLRVGVPDEYQVRHIQLPI